MREPGLSACIASQPAIASAWPQNEAVAVDTGLWLLVTTKWWVAGEAGAGFDDGM